MPRDEAADSGHTVSGAGSIGAWPPVVRRARRRGLAAQAVVEFAIGSIVFFTLIFGTIDYGRVIFMYADLHNAVRDGARYASIHPTDTSGIASVVVARAPALGLTPGAVTSTCRPSCTPGGTVTVQATLSFQPVTQQLLHVGPVTLTSSASDGIE